MRGLTSCSIAPTCNPLCFLNPRVYHFLQSDLWLLRSQSHPTSLLMWSLELPLQFLPLLTPTKECSKCLIFTTPLFLCAHLIELHYLLLFYSQNVQVERPIFFFANVSPSSCTLRSSNAVGLHYLWILYLRIYLLAGIYLKPQNKYSWCFHGRSQTRPEW